MKTLYAIHKWVLLSLVVVVLCGAGSSRAAVPESWKDTGFSIDTAGMTLRGVLEQFGQVYGVRIAFDAEDVGVGRERLRSDSGTEFLDRLSQPYRFRWFVYGNTLYVGRRDDNASMRLEVGEDAVQDAKGALVGMGLFDARFGWGELPDEGVIIISGPREYVRLAKEILMPNGEKAAQKARQIMVFRLKYASATDRVIAARGRTETIPGVKTILSSLIFSDAGSGMDDEEERFSADSRKRTRTPDRGVGEAREIAGFGMNKGRNVPEVEEESSNARSPRNKSSGAASRPRIEADPTLNAIMIYDLASKREQYQDLIDQLDIQPQQIEIEALIVDIDRSKLAELGAEWGTRSGDGNVVSRINAMRGDSKGVDLPLPGSTLLISNAARFYARLKAMEGTGEARILATPTVLTLDNVAAVLDLSQTRYMPLLGERFADLADITAGTMLRVIPRIVQDGPNTRVRLEVDIEDGALGDLGSEANVTRSTISTQAIIELQQTLMIGGYRADSVTTNKQKVPVLGDVPLFGGLFRSEESKASSRERLFLITPRVLTTSGLAVGPTSQSRESAYAHVTAAAEQAERAKEQAAREKAEKERLEREAIEKAAAEKAAKDQLAAAKAAAEKHAADQLAAREAMAREPAVQTSVATQQVEAVTASIQAGSVAPVQAGTPLANTPETSVNLRMSESFNPVPSAPVAVAVPVSAPKQRVRCGRPTPGFTNVMMLSRN